MRARRLGSLLSALGALAAAVAPAGDGAFASQRPPTSDERTAQSGVLTTDLVTIGARYQRGIWIPLFAIRRGDTARSEASSYRYSAYFGVNALDGSVYVRRGEGWRKTTYVRPKTATEIGDFLSRRATFTIESEESLPEPFCRLAQHHQERIDYVVAYFSGGAKAYLKPGTTREEAQALHGALRDCDDEVEL